VNDRTIHNSVALDRRHDIVERWRQAVVGDAAERGAFLWRIMPLPTLDIPPATIELQPVDLHRQLQSVRP
jgi:hypothetical protein